MVKAFIAEGPMSMSYYKDEAVIEAEGRRVVEGLFSKVEDEWTGIFIADDGREFRVVNGYVEEGVAWPS